VLLAGRVPAVDGHPLEPLGVPPAELHALLVGEGDVRGNDDDPAVGASPPLVLRTDPHHARRGVVRLGGDADVRAGVVDLLDVVLQQAPGAHVARRHQHPVVADEVGERDLVTDEVAADHRLELGVVQGGRLQELLTLDPWTDDELVPVVAQERDRVPLEPTLAPLALRHVLDDDLVGLVRWLAVEQILGRRDEVRVIGQAAENGQAPVRHPAAHPLILGHDVAGDLEKFLTRARRVELAVGMALQERRPGEFLEPPEDLLDGLPAVAGPDRPQLLGRGVGAVRLGDGDEDAALPLVGALEIAEHRSNLRVIGRLRIVRGNSIRSGLILASLRSATGAHPPVAHATIEHPR
jgi:hypothetical protein